jgi:hypothetical protein
MWRGHFGVLQSRWAIVHHPTRAWSQEQMWKVTTICVIMHDMIIEEERENNKYDQGWKYEGELFAP